MGPKRPPPPSDPSTQPNRRAKIWLLGIASARPSVPIQRRRLTLPAPFGCILWIGGPTSPTQEDGRRRVRTTLSGATGRICSSAGRPLVDDRPRPPSLFSSRPPVACGDDDSGHTADPLTRKPIHPSIPRNHRGCFEPGQSTTGPPPLGASPRNSCFSGRSWRGTGGRLRRRRASLLKTRQAIEPYVRLLGTGWPRCLCFVVLVLRL